MERRSVQNCSHAPKVIFLGGLFVLALLATAYVASETVLQLVFAIILKLLLQPGRVRSFERSGRGVSAEWV
jgi:predicted PurR-regulated permease PerM